MGWGGGGSNGLGAMGKGAAQGGDHWSSRGHKTQESLDKGAAVCPRWGWGS